MSVPMCDPQIYLNDEIPIKHLFVFICLFLCFYSLSLHLSLPLLLTFGLAETCVNADDKHWYPRLKQATEGWLPWCCLSRGRAKNNRISLLYIPAAWRLIRENLFVRLTVDMTTGNQSRDFGGLSHVWSCALETLPTEVSCI